MIDIKNSFVEVIFSTTKISGGLLQKYMCFKDWHINIQCAK